MKPLMGSELQLTPQIGIAFPRVMLRRGLRQGEVSVSQIYPSDIRIRL